MTDQPRALPAILLIISTFTSIVMWFSPSSYSVITLWLLMWSYIIDRSPFNSDKSAEVAARFIVTHGGALTKWATGTFNWNKHPSTGTIRIRCRLQNRDGVGVYVLSKPPKKKIYEMLKT